MQPITHIVVVLTRLFEHPFLPLLLSFPLSHPSPISTEWVQDTVTATTTWGDIGDWDVSGVADFSHAFSKHRGVTGGSFEAEGNPKAASFVGTAMSKWKTTSLTNLDGTFSSAIEMNADLNAWTVGKVAKLSRAFYGASKFVGTGVGAWDTASVTDMSYTFKSAGDMNADLSLWKVGKVVTLEQAFYSASKFIGTGLGSWDTAAVTTLKFIFRDAGEMNSDLSGWNVAKVTTLQGTFNSASKFAGTGLPTWDIAKVTTLRYTFKSASKFTGTGLGSWDTASVTTLEFTFRDAGEMNSDLSGWNVAKVTTLSSTFSSASKFTGTGLPTWNIAKVTSMADTFQFATSLTSCSKRKIADAWKSNVAFTAAYETAWAADACPPPLTDLTFKQATWGTYV